VETINDELVDRRLMSEQDKKSEEDKLLKDINEKDSEGIKTPAHEGEIEPEEGVYL
jgi:hypothetical protein